jgi:hypothetical protein
MAIHTCISPDSYKRMREPGINLKVAEFRFAPCPYTTKDSATESVNESFQKS